MLARIADKEHSILRPDLLHKRLHLARAGETGFIHHIKVAAAWIASELVLAAACKKALQSTSDEASVAQLSGGAVGWGEALDRVTAALCALTNRVQGGGLAGPGESLQTVDTVAAGQHFLDGSALCWIQEFAGGRVSRGRFFRHDQLNGVLAALHVADGRKLRRNGLAGGELPSRLVLLPWRDFELAAAMPLVEVVAYLAVSEVAHAAPQGVAHDRTFIGNGLSLEAAVLGKGYGFLCPHTRIRHLILLQCCGALPGLCDNAVGLVAKLIRNLPMSGEYLGRRENVLFVACIVGGNLRGLRPAEAAPRDGLLDLLASRAGRLQVLRRVSLYVRRAALAGLDLIAEIAKPEGQLRLIDSGCKLLGIKEATLLQCASRAVWPLCHIEDHRMGMKLRSGIPIDRASGVMLELRGNEFARRLGGIVAADPRLRIPLQLRESDGHCLPVSRTNAVIASDKCGQGNRLGS